MIPKSGYRFWEKIMLHPIEHDPQKWIPVLGKDHAPPNNVERDDDSKISHRALRRDHDLADHLAVLDQPQAFLCLIEREHPVDHRLDLARRDEVHQALEIVVIEAVRANDLELEAPHIAQILLGVVAGGRAADQELAAALEAAQRGMPGVAAGEIDHHVDAALEAAALRLAVFLDRPAGKVDLAI